jgi:hypothetical protein
MKEKVSCYKSELIRKGRRVGNTTRLCDNAIDLLFEGKIVKIIDHVETTSSSKSKSLSKYLLDMIVNRLTYEHRIDKKFIMINGRNEPDCFTIEFNNIDKFGNYILS